LDDTARRIWLYVFQILTDDSLPFSIFEQRADIYLEGFTEQMTVVGKDVKIRGAHVILLLDVSVSWTVERA
jgi:hypothetical protein